MGDRYAESDDNRNILYNDANNSLGYAMGESLPYGDIEMWKGYPSCYIDKLEDTLITPGDSKIKYILEVELRYPNEIKESTEEFHLLSRKN